MDQKEKVKEEKMKDKKYYSPDLRRINQTHSIQKLDLNKSPNEEEEELHPIDEIDETVRAILKINFPKFS